MNNLRHDTINSVQMNSEISNLSFTHTTVSSPITHNQNSTKNMFNLNTSLSNNSFFGDQQADLWLNKPSDWSDDVRMNALFAPFRPRDLNPLHYDNKMKFWKEVIYSFCLEKQIIQFDLNQLETFFLRKNLKPKCLDLVVNEMIREKTLSSKEEALKPKATLIKNVFNKLIWSPLAWSTGYLLKPILPVSLTSPSYSPKATVSSPCLDQSIGSINLNESTSYEKVYVIPSLIETKAQELLKQLQKIVVHRNVDSVIEYEQIYSIAGNVSEKDLDLLIKYLKVNQKLLVDCTTVENKQLIKFTLTNTQNVEPINEMESSFIKLKESERKFENETNKLASQIECLNADIKSYLKQNNKSMALKMLRKRKQIERSMQSKDSVLANIQTMIMNIQQADTNQLTFDIYNKSLSVLKEANKGVNLDKIDDTMCDLQDVFAANTEIEEALAKSPISTKYSIDEQELNKELEKLLSEKKSEDEILAKKLKYSEDIESDDNKSFDLTDMLNSLPDIPIDSPKQKITKSSVISN